MAKDVAEVVFLSGAFAFNWGKILNDASEKDLWVNPVDVAEMLEKFPLEKLGIYITANKIIQEGSGPTNR